MRKHLVLVGLPGSGKSSAGRIAAAQLGRPFLDFDEEIELRTGATVEQIFAERGEAEFRQRERDVTAEVATPDTAPMVLSPGGGWLTNPGARALLGDRAVLIHMKVRPPMAARRLSRAVRVRPLLKGADPEAKLEELLEQRGASYEQADAVIDTEGLSVQQVADAIVQLARQYEEG